MSMNIGLYIFKKYTPLIFLSLVLFAMSSCSSKKNLMFNTGNEKNIPNVPVYELQKGTDINYNDSEQILKPGDAFTITNIKNEILISGISNTTGEGLMTPSNLEYIIKKDNFVDLPVVGPIKLGGLSLPQAQEKVNIVYSSFLEKPQLILKATNMKVLLMGEFGAQGQVILENQPVHLTEIIAKAGGLNNRANKRKIKIIRGDIANPQILIVNLENIQSLADDRLYVHNGDIIYAEPKAGYRTIDQIGSTTTLIGIGLSLINVYFIFSNLLK